MGRNNSTTKSFSGCWTCRLRRKKCDETRPVCDACASLHIVCYFDQTKPEWMDGGVRQEEMAERVKREVKEKAYLRREERAAPVPVDQASSSAASDEGPLLPQNGYKCLPNPICDLRNTPETQIDGVKPYAGAGTISLPHTSECVLLSRDTRDNMGLGGSDTILYMFYHEHLLPFLFPFYRPSVFEGGKAWIMEMMMKSPVIRQTAFCQSSYFISLARGIHDTDTHWETVLAQTQEAFGMLGKALQVIDGAGIADHLHGAVRILASIMQVQRFEIAVLSFDNCHAHLNAGLVLFRQLLDSVASVRVPSPEQEAFRFSSALLVLDDIIASTVLQEEPNLYEYHRSLLGDSNPTIKLEAIVGCQNWALLQIGEIAVLDAWKQQCTKVGVLDVMELVHRATAIKVSLETQIAQLETRPTHTLDESSSILDVFTADHGEYRRTLASQSTLVTRVWAHAALIYLSVVVSGWQPANNDVRYHVSRIVELLSHQISPRALLRGMVWPFCVAGCLAEPLYEGRFRSMVEELQPPGIFGTVRKALQIMENVWRNRNVGDAASRDLASCFRSQGDLVLLV
ncbi:hypothetical protein N0V83_002577 [Neocucurbitaria cava]|uniref:Zn(2)-C6 fungal-type domain-containing protein n=1 Tax=Neocucurbitaria cava TaxID=798079 RepID=A0A9W8YDY3_9PLEO|nr:hypothetical protein N0V83_002577 [Neocucurbitaria cava]